MSILDSPATEPIMDELHSRILLKHYFWNILYILYTIEMCSHSPAISGARIVSPCTQELMVDTGFFDFRELIDKIRSKNICK